MPSYIAPIAEVHGKRTVSDKTARLQTQVAGGLLCMGIGRWFDWNRQPLAAQTEFSDPVHLRLPRLHGKSRQGLQT
jgi:hypothetical protein